MNEIERLKKKKKKKFRRMFCLVYIVHSEAATEGVL